MLKQPDDDSRTLGIIVYFVQGGRSYRTPSHKRVKIKGFLVFDFHNELLLKVPEPLWKHCVQFALKIKDLAFINLPSFLFLTELNKSRRELFEPANVRTSFLEGGASSRLARHFRADVASVSGRW